MATIKGYKYFSFLEIENAREQINLAYNIGIDPNNTTKNVINFFAGTHQGQMFWFAFESFYTIPVWGEGTFFETDEINPF